jgi:hypothetical protein
MRLRLLTAAATVAGALAAATSASTAAAGGGASTHGPEPAFSFCVKTYTAPYLSAANKVSASGSYTCDGPDPRQGQPVEVGIEHWRGDQWHRVAFNLGTATNICDNTDSATCRTLQKPARTMGA